MRRLIGICLVLGILCTVTACQKAGIPRPVFPLTEEAVAAALEQTGMPGAISESETQSYGEGHTVYTLRTQPEGKQPSGFVSSSLAKGNRSLQLFFNTSPVPEAPPFAWEDWKQQLEFAALLYGGFADAQEIYRVFSEKSASEGAVSIPQDEMAKYQAERLAWDASFHAGYCRIRYDLSNSKVEKSSLGTRILEQTPRMTINIYESKAQYEKMQQDAAAAKEKLERSRPAKTK